MLLSEDGEVSKDEWRREAKPTSLMPFQCRPAPRQFGQELVYMIAVDLRGDSLMLSLAQRVVGEA